MKWFEAQNPATGKKAPAWARRAAIDENGRIFVPAIIAGGEMEIFLCAGYDGTPCIRDGKHAYYPADWMKREFPKTADIVEKIESAIRSHKDLGEP